MRHYYPIFVIVFCLIIEDRPMVWTLLIVGVLFPVIQLKLFIYYWFIIKLTFCWFYLTLLTHYYYCNPNTVGTSMGRVVQAIPPSHCQPPQPSYSWTLFGSWTWRLKNFALLAVYLATIWSPVDCYCGVLIIGLKRTLTSSHWWWTVPLQFCEPKNG